MPIKRLQREASFPCVGHLRKGGAKEQKNGKEVMGKDLTYFRFDTDDQRAAKMFQAAYGDRPERINVFLPYRSTEENFSAWQESWLAGGLQHRCDGETCVIWYDAAARVYRQEPKPCPGGCKEVGRMSVIIPELQRLAYVTVETHSVNDIMVLTENLQAVESMSGDLRNIPFVLKRAIREISTPGEGGKRVRRAKSLLSIEVDPMWAALRLESIRQQALALPDGTIIEPAGYLEDFGAGEMDSIEAEYIKADEPERKAVALLMAAIDVVFGDNAAAHIAEIEAKKKKSMTDMSDTELQGWQAWLEQQADKQPA